MSFSIMLGHVQINRCIEFAGPAPAEIVTELKPVTYVDDFDRGDTPGQRRLPRPGPLTSPRDFSRFRFSRIDQVSPADWEAMYRELSDYVRVLLTREDGKVHRSHAVAMRIIESVQCGERHWDGKKDPNLLLFMYSAAKFVAVSMSKQRAGDLVPESSDNRRRRRRRGGGGQLAQITRSIDVRDVVQHLPMIALMVSRLNDLLNPVANPVCDATEGRDDEERPF